LERIFFAIGAGSGFIAVALGAFAAHALKSKLPEDLLAVFETGVRYHFYHALALLAVAWACVRWPGNLTTLSGWLFVSGIVIFSGSLYILALTGVRALGAVTPIGGAAFLAGWFCLLLSAVTN
jgi:uncharacterized membrane protein YgdD (TMEM256/DUF423 family)